MIGPRRGETTGLGSRGWLSAATAERTRVLVTAINAITIASSLKLAGQAQPESEELAAARDLVHRFVGRLATLVEDIRRDPARPVVGADPQLTQIVRGLVAPATAGAEPGISAESVHQLTELLTPTDDAEELRRLVRDLRALRRLLEQFPAPEAHVR